MVARASLQRVNDSVIMSLVLQLPELQSPKVLVVVPKILPSAHVKRLALVGSEVVDSQAIEENVIGLYGDQQFLQACGKFRLGFRKLLQVNHDVRMENQSRQGYITLSLYAGQEYRSQNETASAPQLVCFSMGINRLN